MEFRAAREVEDKILTRYAKMQVKMPSLIDCGAFIYICFPPAAIEGLEGEKLKWQCYNHVM
jgi:hypothetical protein